MKLRDILSESNQFQQMKVYADLQSRAFAPIDEVHPGKFSQDKDTLKGKDVVKVSARIQRKAEDLFKKEFGKKGTKLSILHYRFKNPKDQKNFISKLQKLGASTRDIQFEDVEPEQGGVTVGEYQTQHYDACPGATALYKDIESKTDNIDLAERTAKLQDVLFFIEKHVEEEGYEPDSFYGQVGQILGDQIMAMAEMMGLEEEHQYIQGHIDRINKAVNGGQQRNEDLGKWFGDGKDGGWDRYSTTGDKLGKCGDAEEGEPYSACLSNSKAKKLGKKGRASFVRRKRDAQKKAGDAKKGGEQSKGQKPTYVKTGA
jgi:hypothetical protein